MEISFGTFNFFKYQLARDFPVQGAFELNDDTHVKNVAQYARTVAYAVWFVTARFATKAGLTSSGNVSSFLRYALFSEDADRYRNLIADPYYVPYEEISLTPLDQHNLDLEAPRLASAQRYAFKNYRFKPEHVFDPVKQTNIPVKPMNVKSNSTPTPVHFLQYIKLLETISSSSIYFPIPPIVEAERIHLNKLQTHLIHTANKLRTALRVFDFKYMKKVPRAPNITQIQLNCETRREISLRDKKETEKKNVSDISTQTGEIICVKPIIIPESQKSPFERTQISFELCGRNNWKN